MRAGHRRGHGGQGPVDLAEALEAEVEHGHADLPPPAVAGQDGARHRWPTVERKYADRAATQMGFFRTCDMLVSPCSYAPSGIGVVEAMSCGEPYDFPPATQLSQILESAPCEPAVRRGLVGRLAFDKDELDRIVEKGDRFRRRGRPRKNGG